MTALELGEMCLEAIESRGERARVLLRIPGTANVPPDRRRIHLFPGVYGVLVDQSRDGGYWNVSVEAAKVLAGLRDGAWPPADRPM